MGRYCSKILTLVRLSLRKCANCFGQLDIFSLQSLPLSEDFWKFKGSNENALNSRMLPSVLWLEQNTFIVLVRN